MTSEVAKVKGIDGAVAKNRVASRDSSTTEALLSSASRAADMSGYTTGLYNQPLSNTR